jgi:hypothetical protein
MTKLPGNPLPWVRSIVKQSREIFQSRFSLSYRAEGLLEPLLYVVLDISESNQCIPKGHNKKQDSEDLTESPITFLVTLIVHVASKGKLGVNNEEEVDGSEARQADIEKCNTSLGVCRGWNCLSSLYMFNNLHKETLS